MKIRILLIVLEFIQVCFSIENNLTKDNEYQSCPISYYRGKRAIPEYTRWRSNQVTKQEFIVKVDDDVINPPILNTNPVKAISFQEAPKASEKIIIGGAVAPSNEDVNLETTVVPLDYTRFVPPTTVNVAQVDDGLYLAPALPIPMQLAKGHSRSRPPFPNFAAKHPLRDDSPPAAPQFITRTTTLNGRQYAAISPVAFFTRKTGISTPTDLRTSGEPMLYNTSPRPPRTTLSFNNESPTRAEVNPDLLKIFEPPVEESNLMDTLLTSIGKYSMKIEADLKSSTKKDLFTADDVTTKITDKNEWDDIEEGPKQKMPMSNQDSGDLMTFYNEEESEASNKKEDPELSENDANRKVNAEDSKKEVPVPSETDENLRMNTEDSKKENSEASENYINGRRNAKDNIESKSYPEEDLNRHEIIENDYDDKLAKIKTSIQLTSTTTTVSKSSFSISTSTDEADMALQNVSRDKRRPACNLIKLRPFSFQSPRTLPEVVTQMKKWTEKSPIANWVDITNNNYTTMENPIYMMIVDDPSSGQTISAKQTVLIVAGIQGRDHHAVTAALYVLHQLIERSEAHTELLSKYRFWVVPVLNPDGYDYSMTFPQRREWTKNLRQSWDECKGRKNCTSCDKYGLRCTVQSCYGVNLDRNFEYQWIPAEELHSEHPCGDLYAGVRQLSEHETRAFTHYLHHQHVPNTFIAFKEGEVLGVMYPYSHTRKRRAFDKIYRQRSSKAAQAAHSISGRPYIAGQTSEHLPLFAGGIEDWVDGHLGIDNTYTVMMFRPQDVDSKLITERVVHEAFAATDTLLLYTMEKQMSKMIKMNLAATAHAPPYLLPPLGLLALLLTTLFLLSS